MFKSLCLAALSTVALATYPLELLYQYPSDVYTNIENVALRSNGQLLLSIVTGARLDQLNPASPEPETLVRLTGPQSLIGLAETSHDVFICSAGNFTFGPNVPGGVAGVPGTGQVWTIDLTGPEAKAELLTTIPESDTLNGVTAIPGNEDVVLIADSGLGAVWRVNIKTGEYETAIQNAAFENTPEFSLGINGIRAPREGSLLWTNSAQQTYGIIYIDHDGFPAGEPNVIAKSVNGTNFDDFAVREGTAWIATQPNAVYQVPYDGSVNLVAGGGDDETIASPTSTVFSKDGCTLYVVTGGSGGPEPTSGQVFAIDVCGKGWQKREQRWTA